MSILLTVYFSKTAEQVANSVDPDQIPQHLICSALFAQASLSRYMYGIAWRGTGMVNVNLEMITIITLNIQTT